MKSCSSKSVMALASLALVSPLLLGCGTQAAEAALPTLNLDPERVSVVGLSSGAAMAQQAHFAWSDRLIGAGLIAGPPYGCAEGDLGTALGRCMKGEPDAPDPVRLAERAQDLARSGVIAPLSGLDGDRIYVLHGTADTTVGADVARASYSIYQALAREVASPPVKLGTMVWDGERDIAHAWPTLDQGGTCNVTEAPFIGACEFDASGEMLAALYGPAPTAATGANGKIHSFNQDAYRPDGEDAFLSSEGFLYVPEQCAAGKSCGAVLAFHGCEQNEAMASDKFIVGNGLNRWADVYDLVVVYPQTRASFMPLNPKACWDWWGYSGPDYDTRNGVQMRWLANLTAVLGIPLQP